MKVAIIAPTALLDTYSKQSDIHLCLANLINTDPTYREFYAGEVRAGKHVILDNSCHEKGQSEGPSALIRAIKAINPTEVVLPDCLFNSEKTIDLSTVGYKILSPYLKGRLVMAVPQGETFEEWAYCLDELTRLPITTIGISKDFETTYGGLSTLVEHASTYPVSIHMLGWGRDLKQLGILKNKYPNGGIRSVDSAKPVVFGMAGIPIPMPVDFSFEKGQTPLYPGRPLDYFNLTVDLHPDITMDNIKAFKCWAGAKEWQPA